MEGHLAMYLTLKSSEPDVQKRTSNESLELRTPEEGKIDNTVQSELKQAENLGDEEYSFSCECTTKDCTSRALDLIM